MKATSLIDRFVFFGDFNKIVTEEIPTLIKIFDGYKMTQRQEQTQNGPITVTAFANLNYAISFRFNRMDIEYANNPNLETSESLKFALETFKNFSNTYTNLKGNRVSYVGTEFIPNPNNEPLADLTDGLGLCDVFGAASEFRMRLNSPVNIAGEDCNGVLNVQEGAVQDPSGNNLPAIIVINDINSLSTNTAERFDLNNLLDLFTNMMKLAKDKNQKIVDIIEGVKTVSFA